MIILVWSRNVFAIGLMQVIDFYRFVLNEGGIFLGLT